MKHSAQAPGEDGDDSEDGGSGGPNVVCPQTTVLPTVSAMDFGVSPATLFVTPKGGCVFPVPLLEAGTSLWV